MKKKPSSRGQRGIKVKHILQICVLLGVCIFLIYQVKHSHGNKKESNEKDGNESSVMLITESDEGLVKLGRKYLLPRYHNHKDYDRHVEDEDISNGGKEKERKTQNEDEEVEKEEDEEGVIEEDDTDEQDQSKTPGDVDKDDKLLFEEKEKRWNESSNEKEKETNHTDEAREKHYLADDASSAVSHHSQMIETENMTKQTSSNSSETAIENDADAATSEIETQKNLSYT